MSPIFTALQVLGFIAVLLGVALVAPLWMALVIDGLLTLGFLVLAETAMRRGQVVRVKAEERR